MKWTSIIAIYALFWVMSAYFALRFGMKTSQEAGEDLVPGQADSAPARFDAKRIAIRATVSSLVLFGLYYANWINHWVTVDDLNFFGKPPQERVPG